MTRKKTQRTNLEVMSSQRRNCMKWCRQNRQEGTKMQAELPSVDRVRTMYRFGRTTGHIIRPRCSRIVQIEAKNREESSSSSCRQQNRGP